MRSRIPFILVTITGIPKILQTMEKHIKYRLAHLFQCQLSGVYSVYLKDDEEKIYLYHIQGPSRLQYLLKNLITSRFFTRFNHSWAFGWNISSQYGANQSEIFLKTGHFDCPDESRGIRMLESGGLKFQNLKFSETSLTLGTVTCETGKIVNNLNKGFLINLVDFAKCVNILHLHLRELRTLAK